MTLGDLMAAAVQQSDNTAATLLLRQLGGPSGLEQALRGLSDAITDVDRTEPALIAVVGPPNDSPIVIAVLSERATERIVGRPAHHATRAAVTLPALTGSAVRSPPPAPRAPQAPQAPRAR